MVFWVFVCMSRILDMSLQAPQHDLKQQVHKSSSDYKLGGAIETACLTWYSRGRTGTPHGGLAGWKLTRPS